MSRRKKITDTAAARALLLCQIKRLDNIAAKIYEQSGTDAEPQCLIAEAMYSLAQGVDTLDALYGEPVDDPDEV